MESIGLHKNYNEKNNNNEESISFPSRKMVTKEKTPILESNNTKTNRRASLLDVADAAMQEIERNNSFSRIKKLMRQPDVSSASCRRDPQIHSNNIPFIQQQTPLQTRPNDSHDKDQPLPMFHYQPIFSQMGFGTQKILKNQLSRKIIENSNDNDSCDSNALDATDVAIKAVKDAADRCCTNPFPSNTGMKYVYVKLGVPTVTDIVTESIMIKDDNNDVTINLKTVIRSITHLGHILPIKVCRGGLLSSNDEFSNSETISSHQSFLCTVVAHVSIGYDESKHTYSFTNKPISSLTNSRHISRDGHILMKEIDDRKVSDVKEMGVLKLEQKAHNNQSKIANALREIIGENDNILQEKIELEVKIDVLQKRLELRDASIRLLAKNIEELRIQLQKQNNFSSNEKEFHMQDGNIRQLAHVITPTGSNQCVVPLNVMSNSNSSPKSYTSSTANTSHHHLQQHQLSIMPQPERGIRNNNYTGSHYDGACNGISMAKCPDNGTIDKSLHVDSPKNNDSDAKISDSFKLQKTAVNAKKRKLLPGLTKQENLRQFVQHNYRDFAKETNPPSQSILDEQVSPTDERKKRKLCYSFPSKLHTLLNESTLQCEDNIVSWRPHGRAFIVLKHELFVERIMPRYFQLTKYSSFLRQLNLYGFQRFSTGIDKGAYYHEKFLRGMPFLCRYMLRTKVNGKSIRAASNPDTEPNFYQMTYVPLRDCSTTVPNDTRNDLLREEPGNDCKDIIDEKFSTKTSLYASTS